MSTAAATAHGLQFSPFFTHPCPDPYTDIEWEWRTAEVGSFRQEHVLFPASWSQRATDITASKYFRMIDGAREHSVQDMIDRAVTTIEAWGIEDGYFDVIQGNLFAQELKSILVQQRASFNSPVWFNIGVPGVPQQSSACFILDVEDTMPSILNWYTEEAMIFKSGSGSGVNVSKIRGKNQPLSNGGKASGPLSFMCVADKSAGAIKSGGDTRRAAKMVVMDVDHPDIEAFIWCKVHEEKKAEALKAGGFSWDAIEENAVDFQNANHSVRVTRECMQDAATFGFGMYAERLNKIAEAAWRCGDPGIHFSDTINAWHTTPHQGKIVSSNPCSEFFRPPNEACNLASINLLKYLNDDNTFDIPAFTHTIDIFITAMDILIDRSDYPTAKIAQNSRDYRPLGLGYTNLGAALMVQGLPYDSDEGRTWAGSVTALTTGEAYLQSSRLAEVLGNFKGEPRNEEAMFAVIRRHAEALAQLERDYYPTTKTQHSSSIMDAAFHSWVACTESIGFRNAQVTLLAPTGTISFMMDAETTGIEPLLGLTQKKKLVGGGTLTMMSEVVERAIIALGEDAHRIENHPVFQTALGSNQLPWQAHVKMVAAVQPFLSGGVSKTINMPSDATVEDVKAAYIMAWELGLKSIAIYRDGSKSTQPVCVPQRDEKHEEEHPVLDRLGVETPLQSIRRRLPDTRQATNHKFSVGGHEGYLTVGLFEDGQPGELFLRMSKEGSTLGGFADSFGIAVSLGLQYGVPLKALVDKFTMTRFEPAGMTSNLDIPIAQSIVDYVFRWLDREFSPVRAPARLRPLVAPDPLPISSFNGHASSHSPLCPECGNLMQQTGTCFACATCGTSGGCA